MLFSSIPFLYYFLPLVLVCYFCVPFRWKNFILLFFSLIFYSWGEPRYIFLMVLSILLGYIEGILIERKKHSRLILAGACCIHLGLLMYFKYIDFLIGNLNAIGLSIPLFHIALPIGISFYTFQILSYLIDVYRKDCTAQTNLISFGAYVSMFPQLIAGPIVRYADIEEQLKMRKVTLRKLGQGSMYFIIGLAKKVIIANSTGAVFEEVAAMSTGSLSVLTAWVGVFSYAFQIYFDFSGYSDMAIGLGKMFGFEFKKNFDHPYVSKSATEFWRRWHISLGTWFREYVYIPLGGNRCSVSRNIFNLMVVWTLTGMWHGAAWNFVAWGVYYGVILVMEKYVWGASVEQLPKPVQHIYAGAVILVGWVFFFSPSLGYALRYLWAMIGGGSGIADAQGAFLLFTHWLLFVIAAVGSTAYGRKLLNNAVRFSANRTVRMTVGAVLYIGIFFLSVAFLVTDTFNPFLYFRF